VVSDPDGTLFRALTNGWVPWSVLVGSDRKVVFSESEFDEEGFSTAIEQMYEAPAPSVPSTRRPRGAARCALVLGGGTGGLVAARELRRRLPGDHRVVLVDRSPDHVFQPSMLWHMVGMRRPSQFTRPLARLERKGIEVRTAEVEGLDLEARRVATSAGDVEFESLVVSLGAELAPEEVAGFDRLAHNLYSVEGCARIRSALASFEAGTIGILVTQLPFKCPAAPYEAAFLIEAFVRERGVRRNVELHLFTPEHAPMPVAAPALGDAIADMLAARGIHYHPLFTFQELRPETGELVSADGVADAVDLLIGVPPHQAPEVVRSSPLMGVSGFVHVDPQTLETAYEGVFAIGDTAAVRLPTGKVLPKAGVFAHAQAKVVAERIADSVNGRRSAATFDGKGYCWIELGDGRAGFAGGDFYAVPEPTVRVMRPSRGWHLAKVAFERWWLRRWL
jgi:sulfide:quinone oxidoreductase